MSKLIERVKFGSHGQGSLAKYDDGPNWYFPLLRSRQGAPAEHRHGGHQVGAPNP